MKVLVDYELLYNLIVYLSCTWDGSIKKFLEVALFLNRATFSEGLKCIFSFTEKCFCVARHLWELPCNYPVFYVVMVIYDYAEIVRIILVTPNFLYNVYDNEKYYPGEPVNILIQSLINIIQEKNWVITTKKW